MLQFVVLLLFIVVLSLLIPAARRWLVEEIKAWSDVVIVLLLRATSEFGSELTEDGKAEQELWRERQLRNLRGLALRSKQGRQGKSR